MPRIGLVLGAGGSVGLAWHGGVLAALEEATGWDPRDAEVIIGTSAGSLSGAMLAGGFQASDLRRISEGGPLSPEGEDLRARGPVHAPRTAVGAFLRARPMADPRGLVDGLLHPWSRRPAATLAAALPVGAVSTRPISAGLDAFDGGRWPERRLWVCAVSLRTGRRTVFGREGAPEASLGAAVAASCAIPGWFRPVRIGTDLYVDGGVRSLLNLTLTAGLGLDLVVVSAPMARASRLPLLRPDLAIRQAARLQLNVESRRVRASGTAVAALQPTGQVAAAMGLNAMDASRRRAVSGAARRSTLDYLRTPGPGAELAERLREAAPTPTR